MPCDAIARRDYAAQEKRRRALDGLRKQMRGAQVEVEATDYAGNTAFRATTDDGLIFNGVLDPQGNVTGVQIDGWALAERAGWCDECSLAALRGTPEYDRIVREVRSGSAAGSAYGRDATIIGGGRR